MVEALADKWTLILLGRIMPAKIEILYKLILGIDNVSPRMPVVEILLRQARRIILILANVPTWHQP